MTQSHAKLFCIAAAAVALLGGCTAKSAVRPISPDEQAIYDAMLDRYLGGEKHRQFVNTELSAPPSLAEETGSECVKGLRSVSADAGDKSLAGARFRADVELIEASAWKAADPQAGMAQGKSVEDAVDQAISQSLISFSRVAFSADRNDALVGFTVVCGGLCGSGSVVRLHKTGSRWTVQEDCGQWMS